MNILYLEDRGATAYQVERWMEENKHNVLDAYNPNDATDYWKKRDIMPVECILLDSQLPMDGLSDEQKQEAVGGTLAGWIWLRDTVLSEEPEMRQRTIIYSDYVSILREKVPKKELEGIKVISKRQRASSAREVAKCIGYIAALISRRQPEGRMEAH